MTFTLTIYRSGVWWGWFYTRHVRSWRWAQLYIGRIGIGWQVKNV
jgi:hypothetical protein